MGIGSFFSTLFKSSEITISYSTMKDSDLLTLSRRPETLTKEAQRELFAELDRRDLECEEPIETTIPEEKSPFLKRNISESKSCGCGSGGCKTK
jgi:hypothetical protein